MRTEVLAAILALALPVAAQRGNVTAVTASPGVAGAQTVFTVTGANPCRVVQIDFGDGNTATNTIQTVPARINHAYGRAGAYEVRVRGMGNCGGEAATSVRVDPQGQGRGRGRGQGQGTTTTADQERFRGMDRNADGVITREEWRGSNQSFRVHDWNGDGRLSGDEVRAGARRTVDPNEDFVDEYVFDDWSERRFQQLDHNGDNRIGRAEWHFDTEGFLRVDANRDGFLSRAEFLGADVDDDRADRFDFLDVNNNGRIEQDEWHAGLQAFRALDRNKDGVLSRSEVVGEAVAIEQGEADLFSSMDVNGDRAISVAEWHWSRQSFDKLDINRDGRLTRRELEAATPPATAPGRSTVIVVTATQRWTDTGVYVRTGDMLTFTASGTIRMAAGDADVADPQGSRTGRRAPDAPLQNESAGALIAKIGDSWPILVGGRTGQIRAPRDGRLYLGVNDDHLGDNSGEFRVTVTVSRTLGQ